MGVEAMTLSAYLDRLEAAGLIERRPDPGDRRAKIVALADSKGLELKKLPLSDLKSAEKRITQEVYAALDVAGSVKSRTSYGGTAPANVKREAKKWIKRLEKGAETR